MSKNINLFDTFEYLGEFWFAKRSLHKFSGILKYSPEEGIKIEFISTLRKLSVSRLVEERFILFGCIKELGNITIFPRYMAGNRITWGNAKDAYIREQGTINCELAIVGHHFKKEKDTVFSSCNFVFNHLDNFCSPNPMLDKHEENNILLKTNLEKFNVNLKQSVTYNPGIRQISDLVFLKDDETKKEIDAAVNKILKKRKISGLDKKVKVHYYFSLESKRKKLISKEEYFDLIFRIRNLFLCLTWEPLFLTEISFYKNKKSYQVLRPLYLSKSQLRSTKSETNFHFFPTNINHIKNNFDHVLKYWFEFSKLEFNTLYEVIVDHILNSYDLVSHYLLLVTSIERWQLEQKKPHHTCYDDFIDAYADDKAKDLLLSLLPTDIKKNEIGQALGKIRDIMLHPKKIKETAYKKYKNYLTEVNVGNLTEKIFTLFIVALYKEFNLAQSSIDRIQKDFSSGKRKWS